MESGVSGVHTGNQNAIKSGKGHMTISVESDFCKNLAAYLNQLNSAWEHGGLVPEFASDRCLARSFSSGRIVPDPNIHTLSSDTALVRVCEDRLKKIKTFFTK